MSLKRRDHAVHKGLTVGRSVRSTGLPEQRETDGALAGRELDDERGIGLHRGDGRDRWGRGEEGKGGVGLGSTRKRGFQGENAQRLVVGIGDDGRVDRGTVADDGEVDLRLVAVDRRVVDERIADRSFDKRKNCKVGAGSRGELRAELIAHTVHAGEVDGDDVVERGVDCGGLDRLG